MHRLAAELDALTALTNSPPLGYPAPCAPIPKVTIPVNSTDVVDTTHVKSLVHRTFPQNEIDVLFDVSDRQAVRYLSHLRSPDTSLTIDENTNMPWLQRI